MSSLTKLGLQGFTFGVALTSGGCMPQNQSEIEQLRAELQTLKVDIAALKGESPAQSAAAADAAEGAEAETATATPEGEAGETTSAAPAGFDWDAALKTHDKEKRDLAWGRLREPELFKLAKAHIKVYGASLNTVRCKETTCLITINTPKSPKVPYEPLANPWAQTPTIAHSKPIYSGRTLWSYLLIRHEKDNVEAGADRVDPLALAKTNPELVSATVVLAEPSTEPGEETAKPVAKPATTPKPEAASPPPAPKTTPAKAEVPAASASAGSGKANTPADETAATVDAKPNPTTSPKQPTPPKEATEASSTAAAQ